MKTISIFLSLLLCSGLFYTGCKKAKEEAVNDTVVSVPQVEESSSDLLIQPGTGVGQIKFGMTVQQMKDVLGKPDVEATGISYLYSSLGIEIIARDKTTIDTIICGNPENKPDPGIKALEQACNFKTAEGIGIGSTEAQIIQAFGQPTNRRDNRLLYREKGLIFSLDNDQVIGISLLRK